MNLIRTLATAFLVSSGALVAQTLYVPSGASGIGTSSNGNVGIGTSNPSTKAFVYGTLTVDPSALASNSYSEGIRIGSANNGYSIVNFGVNPANPTGTQANQWWIGKNGADNGFEIWGNSPGDVFHILPSGNVGIGTSTPDSLLTVQGIVHVGGSSAALVLDFGGAVAAKDATGNNRNLIAGWSDGNLYVGPTSGFADTYLRAGTGNIRFSLAGTEKLTLLSNGALGIGTTTPTATRLHIYDTSASETGQWIADINGGYNNGLRVRGGNIYRTDSVFYAGDKDGLGQGLTVLSNNSVGIGTTNPTHLLTVNGAVRAKEVIVDTGWSDYVLDEHYKLAPLSEVESHIKAEKHLPGIPSAKDVAEHGISLGEMQAKLLAKIEELTLHQIEQEKRLAIQSEQISTQASQLAAQTTQMSAQAARLERLETENAALKAQIQ